MINIKDPEEEIKKLQKQIQMHIGNIARCEGAIAYLKMKQKEVKAVEVKKNEL